MPNHSYLTDFKSIKPNFKVIQSDARDWMRFAYGRSLDQQGILNATELEEKILKYTVSESQIAERYTELKDFTKTNLDENLIFNRNQGAELGLGLTERMKFYDKVVNEKAEIIFKDQAEAPHHLIHTSCTGYISPSPLQRLCSKKGWNDTEITHAYHMGCYASMPSIRLANSLCQDGDVHLFNSELCTLHFSTKDFTPEQLIVQSLFADGYIRYRCTAEPPKSASAFKILTILESRVPESEEDMTWVPGNTNFNMTISRDVPLKLAMNIYEGLAKLFEKTNLNMDEMMKSAVFAIHPGGPKILDQVLMMLELEESQIKESRKVLKNHGNMSSATLPHIWKEILESGNYKSGQKVVSLAFGPGLSLFGSVFEICN